MPFYKKIGRELKRIEKDVRNARDALIDGPRYVEIEPPPPEPLPQPPPPSQPALVSEPIADSGHADVSVSENNKSESSAITNINGLNIDPELLKRILRESISNMNMSPVITYGAYPRDETFYPLSTGTTEQQTESTSNLYSQRKMHSTSDDVFIDSSQYMITKSSDQYEQCIKHIDRYLLSEKPIDDKPLQFPNPDFSQLEPIKGPLDIDDEDEILEPFYDDKVDDKKYVQNKCEEPELTIWESTWQEEDTTEEFYSTNSPRRGLALVFINYDIPLNKSDKKQQNESIEKLKNILAEKLEFQVEPYLMTSKHHIVNILQNVKIREDVDGDCLLVVILSQGFRDANGKEFLYCGQDKVHTLELWTIVDGTSCPLLANKPKIFIQLGWAIKKEDKGLQFDSGRFIFQSGDYQEPGSHQIPNMSHFLIISAIEQAWNWQIEREMVNSFIDIFVQVVDSYGHIWDLAKIMTEVQYRITWASLSSVDSTDDVTGLLASRAGNYSRSPSFTSSLMRKILFKPKNLAE